MFSKNDIFWMERAIQLAETAAKNQEVPVGAVLIHEDKIIGEGSNCPIRTCDPSAHAEMIALRRGAKQQKNYRLINTILYVTLEPCMMCLGAMVQARIKRVIFGAHDLKSGAIESVFPIENTYKLNHRIEYQGGLLAEKCGMMLTNFFKLRRQIHS